MLHLLDQHMAIDDHGSASATQQQVTGQSAFALDPRTARRNHEDLTEHQANGSRKSETRTNDYFELKVRSILPFVAVGALSRLGYFSVVSTALHAVEHATDLHCFVVALAYKTLPSPEGGWHREKADQHTAAAVAGLQECVSAQRSIASLTAARIALLLRTAFCNCYWRKAMSRPCAIVIYLRDDCRSLAMGVTG